MITAKVIEFLIPNIQSELCIQHLSMLIKQVDGVEEVYIYAASGRAKAIVEKDCEVNQKFIEIKEILSQAGYQITQTDPDQEIAKALQLSERLGVSVIVCIIIAVMLIFFVFFMFLIFGY